MPQAQRGGFTMIRTFTIKPGQSPTREQFQEVEYAKKYPIAFDEECEELSPEMIETFKVSIGRQNHRKKA